MIYLPYISGVIAIVWGVTHIAATNLVINSFGQLSKDHHRFLLMEWIAEGISLCFIGVLVINIMLLVDPDDALAHLIFRLCSIMLLLFGVLAAFSRARTNQLLLRIRPFIEIGIGILLLICHYW